MELLIYQPSKKKKHDRNFNLKMYNSKDSLPGKDLFLSWCHLRTNFNLRMLNSIIVKQKRPTMPQSVCICVWRKDGKSNNIPGSINIKIYRFQKTWNYFTSIATNINFLNKKVLPAGRLNVASVVLTRSISLSSDALCKTGTIWHCQPDDPDEPNPTWSIFH